jgi:hypothetical protein
MLLDAFSSLPHEELALGELITFIAIGVALIGAAGLTVLAELIRPKPQFEDAKPAGEGDFKFPTATEERHLPVFWGRNRISGPNVIWWGDMSQKPIKERVKTGLFSSKTIVTGYKYFVGMQFSIAVGRPEGGITFYTARAGEKYLIPTLATVVGKTGRNFEIDQPKLFGGDTFGIGGIEGNLRVHGGQSDQDQNDYLKSFQGGASQTPAYRHTVTAVFEGGYIGNSPQIQKWDFELAYWPDNLALTGDGHIVNTYDANPAEVLYELLINDDFGYGLDTTEIDFASFQAAGNTLKTENSGFAMVLDRALAGDEFINLILSQIDGILYVDRATGKYTLKLARDDYSLPALDTIDNSNLLEVKDFSRTAWDATVNQVRVKFTNRQTYTGGGSSVNEYRPTYAVAQDLGNQRMQDNEVVTAQIHFPGVKDETLANNLAARELKFLSFPLANATLVVDRTFSDAQVGDVFKFTDTDLGVTELPMRCVWVDYGDFLDGRVTLGLVQDIFAAETGYFGNPPAPEWTPPEQTVAAIPLDDQIVMEGPRAIVKRDPEFPDRTNRIWCGAQAQAGEIDLSITQRNASGTPSGAYEIDGEVGGMVLVGVLNTAINAEDTNPATTMVLNNTEDSVSLLRFGFGDDAFSVSDVGQNLAGLLMIEDEFLGTTGIQTFDSTTVTIETVYRGLLDSVPADHASGAKVWLLFSYMNLNDSEIPEDNNVDVKLISHSRDNDLAEGTAITNSITLNKRYRRPYPPHEMTHNSVRMDTTSVSIDNSITNPDTGDDQGIATTFKRKDYRTDDEVESVGADAETIDASFPAAQTHQNQHEGYIVDEETGAEILVYTKSWFAGTATILPRPNAIGLNNGALTHDIRSRIKARHTDTAVVLEALQSLDLDSSIASTLLSGKINLGFIPANSAQGPYTVTDGSQDHVFDIGTALTADVQYQLNSTTGSWTQLIPSGNTTGTILTGL